LVKYFGDPQTEDYKQDHNRLRHNLEEVFGFNKIPKQNLKVRPGLHGRTSSICPAVDLRPYLNIFNESSYEFVHEVDGPSSKIRPPQNGNLGLPFDSVLCDGLSELKFWSVDHIDRWTVYRRPATDGRLPRRPE